MSKIESSNKWKFGMLVAVLAVWTCAPAFAVEVPFEADWIGSGHADATAEAFSHWDTDDPQEIPTSCARCHSTPGYRDFLGADGTAVGVVDNPAPIGTTVECIACHNEVTQTLDSVVFPSGVEVTGLSDEARCMQCHQGRAWGGTVDEAIAEADISDEDAVSDALGFVNIHYYAAAATRFGGVAKSGYEYEGKSYDAKFAHVEGIDTCDSCHNPHTLEIKIEDCSVCHPGVSGKDDLKDVRLLGSTSDYDGDGNTDEGIKQEIQSLQAILYDAIQAYAAAGTPIVYDAHSYPYFFVDTNANGLVDEGEASYGNRYNAWTPRLLKAAYNFQVSQKDPGGFAHGGKYIIQLLYDSTEDLDASLVAGLARSDAGHFAGSAEAFRHWDEDGEVSGSCAKCHSATGLPFFLEHGVNIAQPISNGMLCTTCHSSLPEFTRYDVEGAEFPSGAFLSFGEGEEDSNLCINCHQGRSSTPDVDAAVAGIDPDTVSSGLRFMNIHYFPAGVTLFGTEAQGAYEYPGVEYNGKFEHVDSLNSCTECHDTHSGEVQTDFCGLCHGAGNAPEDIRTGSPDDFDGDGDTNEGIAGEIDTLAETLYAALQNYAANVAGTPIIYDAHSYPYFFVDTNGNGDVDPGESGYGNRYNAFTPRSLKAAYNYQYAQKDPGAFVHNGKYVIQVLSASIADISQ